MQEAAKAAEARHAKWEQAIQERIDEAEKETNEHEKAKKLARIERTKANAKKAFARAANAIAVHKTPTALAVTFGSAPLTATAAMLAPSALPLPAVSGASAASAAGPIATSAVAAPPVSATATAPAASPALATAAASAPTTAAAASPAATGSAATSSAPKVQQTDYGKSMAQTPPAQAHSALPSDAHASSGDGDGDGDGDGADGSDDNDDDDDQASVPPSSLATAMPTTQRD